MSVQGCTCTFRGGKDDDDLIEVINAKTGETGKISRADSRDSSADGLKTTRYKNSSKPLGYSVLFMLLKARKEAIHKEQKKIALKQAIGSKKGKPSIVVTPTIEEESEPYPSMPTCNQAQMHREKINPPNLRLVNSLVARPVNKREIRANPKAQEALDLEWKKLVKKDVWLYDTVPEWKDVSNRAKKPGEKVHVGKVFEICVEKGSEGITLEMKMPMWLSFLNLVPHQPQWKQGKVWMLMEPGRASLFNKMMVSKHTHRLPCGE